MGGTFACARACARSCVCTCACKWDEACVRGAGWARKRRDIDSGSGLRSLGDAREKLGVQQECVEVDVLRGLRGVPGWCVRGWRGGREH